MQVATVKASTSLRTKKRGKVPPRLDTLKKILASIEKDHSRRGNIRSK